MLLMSVGSRTCTIRTTNLRQYPGPDPTPVAPSDDRRKDKHEESEAD